jgi:hypothetical protein
MPDSKKQKRTILKHVDPSQETWDTAKTKIKRFLKSKAAIKGFSVQYRHTSDSRGDTKIGSLKAGVKSDKKTASSKSKRSSYLGASWTYKF